MEIKIGVIFYKALLLCFLPGYIIFANITEPQNVITAAENALLSLIVIIYGILQIQKLWLYNKKERIKIDEHLKKTKEQQQTNK